MKLVKQRKPKAVLKTRITYTLKSLNEWKNYSRELEEDELVFDEYGHYKIGTGDKTWSQLPYAKSLDKFVTDYNPTSEKLNLGTTWLNTKTKEVFILVSLEPILWKNLTKDFVTKQYINDALDDKISFQTGKRLSSNDYTDEDKKKVYTIPNLLKPEELPGLLENKANKEDVYSKVEINNSLETKIDANSVYAKNQFDSKLESKHDSKNIYKKEEFDEYLAKRLEKKADLVEGVIPSYQIPSTIDNIQEYESKDVFPHTGVGNKIYVDKSTEKLYRWNGIYYIEVSPTIKLGKTENDAYPGSNGVLLEEKANIILQKLPELERAFGGNLATLNTIGTDNIEDGAVTEEKLVIINTNKIQDNAITEEKIANNAITQIKLLDNSITNDKIASLNINKIVHDKQIIFVQ